MVTVICMSGHPMPEREHIGRSAVGMLLPLNKNIELSILPIYGIHLSLPISGKSSLFRLPLLSSFVVMLHFDPAFRTKSYLGIRTNREEKTPARRNTHIDLPINMMQTQLCS